MQLEELLAQARDAMTVKRVFGDPIEKDGVTVIPVANVMGGAGGGSGEGPVPASRGRRGAAGRAAGSGGAAGAGGAAAEAGEGDAGGGDAGETDGAGAAGGAGVVTSSGMGAGYGIRATPAGVYVIKDGEVEWEPALDVTRVAIMGMVVAIVFLFVVRSIAKSRS